MVVRGGASAAQDGRFSKNKMKKDMAAFAAPPEYSLTVNFKKICWEVMEGWITQRVTELLRGVEDEVLVGTILESLKAKEGIKPKDLHHDLVPFLANNTTLFVKELWDMLHSASNNATGVPDQLQQKHKEEQRKKDEHQAVIQARIEEARKRQNTAVHDAATKPHEQDHHKQSRDGRSDHRDHPSNRDRDPRESRHDDRRGDRRLHDSHARDNHRRRERDRDHPARDSDRRDHRGRDDREYDRHAADLRRRDRRSPGIRDRREWGDGERKSGRACDRERQRSRSLDPEGDGRELRRMEAFRHREGQRDDEEPEREGRGRQSGVDASRQLRRMDAMTDRDRTDRDVERSDQDAEPRQENDGANPSDSPREVRGDCILQRQDGFRRKDTANNADEEDARNAADDDPIFPGPPSRGQEEGATWDRRGGGDEDSPARSQGRRDLRRQEGFRRRDADGSRDRERRRDGENDLRGGSKREREDVDGEREEGHRNSVERGVEREGDREVNGGGSRGLQRQDAFRRRDVEGKQHRGEDVIDDGGSIEEVHAKHTDGGDVEAPREDRYEKDSSHSKSKKRRTEKSDKERKSKKSKKHKHRDRDRDSDRERVRERSPAPGRSPKQRRRADSPEGGRSDVEFIDRGSEPDLEALREEARQAKARMMSTEERA